MTQKINRTQIDDSAPVFTAVTFANGWSNYGENYSVGRYYKDSMGIVHLSGLIKGGTTGASAFVLPVGFRPAYRLITGQLNAANTTMGRIDILPTGEVQPQSGVNTAWITLENISFAAEQ